tara:strand:+ start:213 stop:617 length:405 start_codon:yes stop_codon:yes gene_type:complete
LISAQASPLGGAISIAHIQLCLMKDPANMSEEQFRKTYKDKQTSTQAFLQTPGSEVNHYVNFSEEPNFCVKVTNDQGVTWLEVSSIFEALSDMKFIFKKTQSPCMIEIVGLYWLEGEEGSALEVLIHRERSPAE